VIEPLACIVPALNAAPSLPKVLAGLRASVPEAFIIGVDDGSTDDTRSVMTAGCDLVLVHEVNQGKGAALKTAFREVLARGFAGTLTIDSDGQHDPAYARPIAEALDTYDVVVGVRRREGTRMPLHRRMSNAISTRAISLCAGCEIPDAQSGYRAMRAEVLRKVNPPGTRYEFETAFLIQSARAGFRIGAVPIPTIYGAPSYFREFEDAARIVRTIWDNRPGTYRG
jgi:glycosyltransferase involved in cell wall biosynthesis